MDDPTPLGHVDTLPEPWRTSLEEFADSACVVDSSLSLLYTNPGWRRFADANGGSSTADSWTNGTSILEACAEPRLRSFYRELFGSCLDSESAESRPVQHDYECSSPTELRKFRMSLYRLADPTRVLVLHSKILELPIEATDRPWASATEIERIESEGVVRQCAHCRMVQSAEDPTRWLWIPQFVESCPKNTSHTFCGVCLEYYYPDDDA